MYAALSIFLSRFFKKSTIFKIGFNLSPMYRRSTGRVTYVSDDLHTVKVKIPLSYRNSNYVGSIFGGSLFSATDPVYMVQLIQILGEDYVVWDKQATIKFKRPAKETGYADFMFTQEEVDHIKKEVAYQNEIDLIKTLAITDYKRTVVFAEVSKTIYIANKTYYKEKRRKKK